MSAVTRLVTSVEATDGVLDPRRMSVSARHEAVLEDGRRVLLLDDRGWTVSGPPDVWSSTTLEEVVATSRVVGPDEPAPGRSAEEEATAHWRSLAHTLRRQGVVVDAEELRRLPHDVELGERLLTRLPSPRDGSTPPG